MKRYGALLLVVMLCSTSLPLIALVTSDPPDSEVNPLSGNIETAAPVLAGSNQDIRYAIDPGIGSLPASSTVTDNPLDDRNPRLMIAANGDAWVVWWRDDAIDKVLYRKRRFSDGSWSNERILSDAGESSRNPVAVHDGANAWVVFEYTNGANKGIAVNITIDEPDPIGCRTPIAQTGFTGNVQALIHAESGHLWVTWVDGPAYVGYSVYSYTGQTWSAPAFESYATDNVGAARGRVRAAVLGN